jgi:frataxin-like iron-binding protein CyaY
MNNEEFLGHVSFLMNKFEVAFNDLKKANDQGRITVTRVSPKELQIKVTKIGTYRIYADESTQYVYLQSPQSGLYNYKYDIGNQQWKSEMQSHIIDELLMREFITFTKGTLTL